MAPPTLYHVPKCISSPIYQVLLELGVVDNPVRVESLSFADLKSPEHLLVNPMGTCPAFVDSDRKIRIWESGAVLSHLLEDHDPTYTKLHPPPHSENRAKFLHIQQFIIATVYPFVAALFLHTLKSEDDRDEKYVESATTTWRTLLAPTLVSFLDGPFFLGETMSAIDLLVVKPLGNANSMGLLEEFPPLYELFQTVSGLPSYAIAYGMKTKRGRERRSIVLVPAIAGEESNEFLASVAGDDDDASSS